MTYWFRRKSSIIQAKKRHLHVKRQLDLGLEVAVIDFEEAVHKLSKVNEFAFAEVKHIGESLANDAR